MFQNLKHLFLKEIKNMDKVYEQVYTSIFS